MVAKKTKKTKLTIGGARTKLTLADLKKTAKERKGFCLAKKYVNNREKLEWRCSKKHKFKATTHSVRKGTWCPICAAAAKKGAAKKGAAKKGAAKKGKK